MHRARGSRSDPLHDSAKQETLIRYLQDLPDADKPTSPLPPKFHTGKIPNSKAGDGKPRLLLMGQRRQVLKFSTPNVHHAPLTPRQKWEVVNIEVFVHKMDGLSDDYRSDTYRDIMQRVEDELSDAGIENPPVFFHQTSIYDHTIFEAFSKVIQKLIPELPSLEALLDSLCANCRIEKAYLFDVLSKIYIATDTSPSDIGSYEICSDYIDVIVDISEIYGWDRNEAEIPDPDELEDGEAGNQDAESLFIMDKSKGTYLYLREINKYLALICIMGEDNPSDRKALIDYNVGVFQEALKQIFPR